MARNSKRRSKRNSSWVDFAAVRSTVSIEQVLEHYELLDDLDEKQDGYTGECPFHEGDSESPFHVSLTKNAWYCFGCEEGGNVLDFTARMEDCSIKKAALILSDVFDVGSAPKQKRKTRSRTRKRASPPQESSEPEIEAVSEPVSDDLEEGKGTVPPSDHENAIEEGEAPAVNKPLGFELKKLDPRAEELQHLGLQRETLDHFGSGWCTTGIMAGRLAVPVHSIAGSLLAYAGLGLDHEGPRWKFPDNFNRELELYNIHRAMDSEQNEEEGLIVVPDILDVWRLYERGLKNVVAIMGKEISEPQLQILVPAVGSSGKVSLTKIFHRKGEHPLFYDLLTSRLWVRWLPDELEQVSNPAAQ